MNKDERRGKHYYEKIQEYCADHDRTKSSTNYSQEVYKFDFFLIFLEACRDGYCGGKAVRRFEQQQKRLKRPLDWNYYFIWGDSIQKYLKDNWLKGITCTSENKRMVNDLSEWWDAWEYAWYKHPASSLTQKRQWDEWIQTLRRNQVTNYADAKGSF